MKNEPLLVKSLDLLGMIQRCAKHADQKNDERLSAAVDTLLSALVAANGLRNAFATLPAEVRPHHALVSLISRKV